MKVAMTMVWGSIVTSVMSDRVAKPGAPRLSSRWGWSAQEDLVARAICLPMTANQN